MTWEEAKLLLQLEAEERTGFVMRERARLAKAQENAAFAAVTGASRAG